MIIKIVLKVLFYLNKVSMRRGVSLRDVYTQYRLALVRRSFFPSCILSFLD